MEPSAILDFGTVTGIDDIIIQSILLSIFLGVSNFQGVKLSVFPLTLLVIITTVLQLPRIL